MQPGVAEAGLEPRPPPPVLLDLGGPWRAVGRAEVEAPRSSPVPSRLPLLAWASEDRPPGQRLRQVGLGQGCRSVDRVLK